MLRRVLTALLAAVLATACGKNTPPTPSPPTGNGETITGRERIGWDQPAPNVTELATFRYAIYVDNVRSEVGDVSCASTAGVGGFPCSGRMPPMSVGSHVLEMAAFIEAAGLLESARSQPLRVTVTGLTPASSTGLTQGSVLSTADGARLRIDILYEGLREPTALAISPGGRAFVGTADGLMILQDGSPVGPPQLTDGTTLAIDFSPSFDRDALVFVTQALEGSAPAFRTSRFRDMGGWLAERMVILEHGPPSAEPAAALRFGPDARLYLAFDDGGSAEAARRMSEWRGKLLRMEPDGRTPDDQPAASPVVWRGLSAPRGFDWSPDGAALWLAETSGDGVERLRVIVAESERPRRAMQRATYVLPAGLGASGLAFYRARTIRPFAGDLFVAGGDGGYILRVRFDPEAAGRPVTTEKLLEGIAGPIRALAMGTDGAIYFCTDTQLARIRQP